jgi:DNA-binding NarL/FixJ family response regulator
MMDNSNPGATKARVFIVDDHPVVRSGLAVIVDAQPDMAVCGDAESARQVRKRLAECQPDVLLLDVSLADASGIELIKELRGWHPGLRVLVVSMHDEKLYAERALRAGAHGYVMKDAPADRVVAAIRKIVAGGIFVSPAMTTRLLSRIAGGEASAERLPMALLSDRELEVFEFIGRGMRTRDVAETLHLSIKTVESHRSNIKRKLKLPNAIALLQYATHWVQQGKPM